MSDEGKYKISVELESKLAAAKDIVRELQGIRGEISGLGKTATTAAADVQQGFGMGIGINVSNAVMNFARTSLAAFADVETGMRKLSAAIGSGGGNVAELVPQFDAFAKKMQEITVYGNDQILQMQTWATTMGVSGAQMDGVVKSAIGLSSALGMDLRSATKAASEAAQGKTGALENLIPTISQCKSESEKLAKINELAANGFAQAKAEADSTAGKVRQLSNAWGNLAESAGKAAAPALVEIAGILKSLCDAVSENETAAAGLTAAMVGVTAAVGGGKTIATVAKAWTALSAATKGATAAQAAYNVVALANPVGLAIGAIAAVGVGVAYAYKKCKEADAELVANVKKNSDKKTAMYDAEIAKLNQWGITASDAAKRQEEIAVQIEKLRGKIQALNYDRNVGSRKSKLIAEAETEAAKNEIGELEKVSGALQKADKSRANYNKELKEATKVLRLNELQLAAAETWDGKIALAREELRLATEKLTKAEREYQDALNGNGSPALLKKLADSVAAAKLEQQAKAEAEKLARESSSKVGKSIDFENRRAELDAGILEFRRKMELAKQEKAGNASALDGLATLASKREEDYKLAVKNLDIEKRRVAYVDEFVAKYKGLNDARGITYSEDKLRVQAEENFAATIAKEKDVEKLQKAERKKAIADKKEEYDLELKLLSAKGDIANYDELGRNATADKIQLEISARGLAREMTDALKTEAMCQDEIDILYEKQLIAAREKLALEEKATRAVEDQNRAKTLSNVLQDIILRHKIAELEAEGKILEANKLKRELEIQSKLDSMKGLSSEKKKEYAKMMRETKVLEDRTARRNQGGSSSIGSGYSGSGRSGSGITSGRSGGSSVGETRQSNRRHAAPSRKQGETWEEADERYLHDQDVKAQEKDLKRREREKVNAMSPSERMAYHSAQRVERLDKESADRESRRSGIVKAPDTETAEENAIKDAKSQSNLDAGVKKEKAEKLPQKKEEDPDTKQSKSRTSSLQQDKTQQNSKQSLSGGNVVKLLSSIEKTVKSLASS